MSIRTKLLLLSLATLALPWAGCQYAREMESSLRDAEQQALLAVANTLATSLQDRTDLLYRGQVAPASGTQGFLAIPLLTEPNLDGQVDDWPDAPQSWRSFESRQGDQFKVLTGSFDRYLYVRVEVRDRDWVFDADDAAALDPAASGTRRCERCLITADLPLGRCKIGPLDCGKVRIAAQVAPGCRLGHDVAKRRVGRVACLSRVHSTRHQ